MEPTHISKINLRSETFDIFMKPIREILPDVPLLTSRGEKPLSITFEHQVNAMIYYHLEEHESLRNLIQVLNEDNFARQNIAPAVGISRSGLAEAINHRGLEQTQFLFERLAILSGGLIPRQYAELGDIVLIDGTLIDAVLSMYWADYRSDSRKAKAHFGFDLNTGIPSKIFLTNGKGAERPFVSQILAPGQTGVTDRGYQCHKRFDDLGKEGKYYACRIKNRTIITVIKENHVCSDSHIFRDTIALLGTPGVCQSEQPVRVVGYRIGNTSYLIATNRFDLTAEHIALIYKLRWDIEKFFKWWKKHVKVYHLIARSRYGVMVQLLSGLIAFLLMAIYCRKQHNQTVSVSKLRQLRIAIRNELRNSDITVMIIFIKEQNAKISYAKT
jgi:hypothetical protein